MNSNSNSKNHSETMLSVLSELDNTSIYEFGGSNTWPYETEP